MDIMLTIFTPTYNRAYILRDCYESLCRQTCKDFEWLIVDDGSTDNTQKMVLNWIRDEYFTIRYIYQLNGGKHRAHNLAIKISCGELFMCVDSDDLLTDYAVERILNKWKDYVNYTYIGGMIALKGYKNSKLVGTCMPERINYTSMYNLYRKYHFRGDNMPVFRTNILKENPFPEIDDEKFITEALVYNRISCKYQMALINEILYKCEYLSDGYTRNIKKLFVENPKGYALYYAELLMLDNNLKSMFKATINYVALSLAAKYKDIVRRSPRPFITTFLFPMAYIYYHVRYKQEKEDK